MYYTRMCRSTLPSPSTVVDRAVGLEHDGAGPVPNSFQQKRASAWSGYGKITVLLGKGKRVKLRGKSWTGDLKLRLEKDAQKPACSVCFYLAVCLYFFSPRKSQSDLKNRERSKAATWVEGEQLQRGGPCLYTRRLRSDGMCKMQAACLQHCPHGASGTEPMLCFSLASLCIAARAVRLHTKRWRPSHLHHSFSATAHLAYCLPTTSPSSKETKPAMLILLGEAG